MTDHATEAERFHNEYRRLRTPGQLPTTADVLALANYHATMAVVDAVRELAPNAAQEATGGDLAASQAEPGQVDGGKATEAGGFSDCPRCDRHLRAVQHFKSRAEKAEAQLESGRRGGVVLSATDYTALVARAERAETEAERDAILDELRNIEVALSQRCAHSIGQTREAHHRAWDDVTGLLDRYTPEG